MAPDPILEAFDHQLRRRPQAPLVASPTVSATVADVDALARAAATVPAGRGLAPGTLVAISAADGVAFLASYLAVRRLGLVPVLLEVKAPPAERERIAEGLGCRWIFTCRRAWPVGAGDWRLTRARWTGAGAGERVLSPEIGAVKLTSGSTGRPRGIVAPAAALAADEAALARSMGLADDERILAAIPMSHAYGLSSVALPALVRGSLLVVSRQGDGPIGPLRAARALGATYFPTVPAFLRALVSPERPPRLPESLRLTVSAGAPLLPETALRFREVYGRPVHAFYGSSETGGICFDREGGAGERGTVGEPVEGVRVGLEPVDVGEATAGTGVVTVRSPAVAEGYLPDGDERLSGGRFRTGDLGRWCDGELVLLGRTDDLINVRGKKVNPREVEEILARLPGVRDVAALGIHDCGRGETTLRVVVACDREALSPDAVIGWCRDHLAEHKVPRSVALVERIPRTSRGKVDREALLASSRPLPDDALRFRAG